MNPEVEWFFEKDTQWQEEYLMLRKIILDCGLKEELKWGVPCYTLSGKNVVLMHGFKEYCALLFHKGALLKDTDGILVQQTENVQAARQIRFTGTEEIEELEAVLKAYIFEAIKVEKAGLKVELKKTRDFDSPEELQQVLEGNPEFKTAFESLTPGRQRGYILYFAAPKQSKTRVSRIEKYWDQILKGKGLNDK